MYTRDTVGNTFLHKNFTFDSKTLDLKLKDVTDADLPLTEISALIVLNYCSRIISLLVTSLASQVILRIILICFFQSAWVCHSQAIHTLQAAMFIFRVVPCQFGGYYRLIPLGPNHRNTDHPIGFTLTRCPRDAPQKQGWSLVRNVRQNIGRCLSKDSEGFTNFYPSRFTLMGSQWTFIDLLWNQLKYANVGVHSYQYSRQAWNILDSRLSCMGPSIYNAIDCQWLATTTKKTMRRRMNEKKKSKKNKEGKRRRHHRACSPSVNESTLKTLASWSGMQNPFIHIL